MTDISKPFLLVFKFVNYKAVEIDQVSPNISANYQTQKKMLLTSILKA